MHSTYQLPDHTVHVAAIASDVEVVGVFRSHDTVWFHCILLDNSCTLSAARCSDNAIRIHTSWCHCFKSTGMCIGRTGLDLNRTYNFPTFSAEPFVISIGLAHTLGHWSGDVLCGISNVDLCSDLGLECLPA